MIALGIDTGGTYTDAVLVDTEQNQILASAKALTTHHDLAAGILEAITTVFEAASGKVSTDDVELVGLSTTLATNAIVEGQGGSVCLILIGYDPELIRQYGFEHDLVTEDVVYINGGHNVQGDEIAPLDEEAVRKAVSKRNDQVEAFAVSGYFGVRNPAQELRVKAIIEEMTRRPNGLSMPITCGHELTTHLNSIRRATTAALNARLIPLLRDLIATIRHTLDEFNIRAPLMVVKGDGSLVRNRWAMRRPIETILSGPAASVVGACYLSGSQDVWVVDVGGTTTDIAMLRGGHPRLNPEGAQVGQWQTMIEAADIHTMGVGGDSRVQWQDSGFAVSDNMIIGPNRTIPLCVLADKHPQVVSELKSQIQAGAPRANAGCFLVGRRTDAPDLSETDQALLELLKTGPQSLVSLAQDTRFRFSLSYQIQDLTARQLIHQAGFTPTDALHALGNFQRWNAEASKLGAELLAKRLDLSSQTVCERVVQGVSDRIAAELVSTVLAHDGDLPNWKHEPAAVSLLARALDGSRCEELDCQLSLKQPIVAIGAPVAAYLPRTSELLHTELVIPNHADVANAIGAVVGGVVQRASVQIQRIERAEMVVFRTFLPGSNRDFKTLEEAVRYTQNEVSIRLETLAREAGADHVEVQMSRQDQNLATVEDDDDPIYFGTELHFSAMGRPRLSKT